MKNIMILNVDKGFIDEYSKVAHANGFSVFVVSTCAEALTLLNSKNIDVAMLSIGLTKQVGTDLVSFMDRWYPDIKKLVINKSDLERQQDIDNRHFTIEEIRDYRIKMRVHDRAVQVKKARRDKLIRYARRK